MTEPTAAFQSVQSVARPSPGYSVELHNDVDGWLQNWIVANPAPTNPHRGERWAARAHAEYWQAYQQREGVGFPLIAMLLPTIIHALIGVLVRLTLHGLFPDVFERQDLTGPTGPATLPPTK